MEFDEVVKGRHSVRDFDGTPVPEADIRSIVEEAGLAPSWGDAQPWRVYVATGKVMQQIRSTHEKSVAEGVRGHSDIPTTHRVTWGKQLHANMAAYNQLTNNLPADAAQSSEEKARLRQEGKDGQNAINSAHLQHPQYSQNGAADGRPAHPAPVAISNSRLFNAGTVMYVTAQKHINEWHLLDLGAFEEALVLSAKNRGYDTMIAYELVRYPEEVRRALDIPDNETLVIGMCIGHATDAPINDLRVHHMPVDQYLTIRS